MADARFSTIDYDSETLNSNSSSRRVLDLVKNFNKVGTQISKEDMVSGPRSKELRGDDGDADLVDSVLCVSGSKLVRTGFDGINFTENIVKFINAGGGAINKVGDSATFVMPDTSFEGGDVLRTDEGIIDGGDLAPLYQSARFGNFCYQFNNLPIGDYFVDLHFGEIVNTNGPKGMRVFDVFMQEEKVVSELDIYSIVGANKPLQLVDIRVTVGESRTIAIRFQEVNGNPVVSGICIKEAPKILGPQVKQGGLVCNRCAAEVEVVTPAQNRDIRMRSISKYEKKIEELSAQYQLKTNECYEAWMSLTAANKELQKVRMELDNKSFENHCLDQAKAMEAVKLRDISSRYKHERMFWAAALNELKRNVKIMKEEHSQLSREAHECADSIPELNKMVAAVQALVAQCDDLKLKYSDEQLKRKQLYNQIQEAKGNIRVFCRCRPLTKEEASAGYSTVVDFSAAKDGDLGIVTGSTKKIYKFDRVYTPKDDQVDVFADASPMVTSVLDGYNVCIFAYGQTGTGKTFTMEGSEQNRGVNYRTLEQLFKIANAKREAFTYKISVSVLEIYNEQIRDLLATSPTTKKLEIRQDPEGVHHVPGIVEAKVQNIKEVWDILQAGSNARALGSNNVNEHSSRSHCMLCITVGAKNLINGECTQSKLWLVDLAGSERLAKTEARGDRLKEAQNINRSLSALGDVISALASKSTHIPYRNSKLTHLLQDSLGGDSKTLMFVQISPLEQDLGETVSSLNFATRVRRVELGPAKKQIDMGELQKLKMLLDKAKQESQSKDEFLRTVQENFQLLEEKFKDKDQICRSQQEKLKDLENQLESKTELNKQMEKQFLQVSQGMKEKEEICFCLEQKVDELEDKLRECSHVDSKALQHKIVDLENKLKKRTHEIESQNVALQEKVTELENKLKLQNGNTESQLLLREKIKELEERWRQQDEVPGSVPQIFSSEKSKVTPIERKIPSAIESTIDRDSQSLSRLKPSNCSVSQGSVLLKGTDSLRELRRKQEIQNRGSENNFLLSAPSTEKKLLPIEPSKARQIDPSKAFARVTRTAKPLSIAQRLVSGKQVQGTRGRENNSTRVWLR